MENIENKIILGNNKQILLFGVVCCATGDNTHMYFVYKCYEKNINNVVLVYGE